MTTERTISVSGIVCAGAPVAACPRAREADAGLLADLPLDPLHDPLGLRSRPWMNSQRGLSGTLRRTSSTAKPITAPSTNDSRQPRFTGKIAVLSITTASSEPPMPPSQ